MRWIEEDGRVTVFRNPSGYSNGNTFDFEGRQLSCEHGGRRVVRYEPNGTTTVIAEKFQGKRLNSPNDIVVHPDGSIWFTDPNYGIRGNYEGFKADSELPTALYRVDAKTLQIEKLTDELSGPNSGPNGICFSPDYKKLYVADTGSGREIRVWDIDGKAIRNGKRFAPIRYSRNQFTLCRRWHSMRRGRQYLGGSTARRSGSRTQWRSDWYDSSAGNMRQHLLRRHQTKPIVMTASESLYSVYVETTGAHIA
jgi:gluconolactonase